MDIKILSEFLTGKPAVSEADSLLTQLRAAGTIEAEVIKVLQGKLLLSSRLGEILTTNTLNYKPGDQINLRLGGDEQNPILKASPRIPAPIILDSAQNPRLKRALPEDRPVLAVVNRMTAQRIEIRLAGQVLTLPRQPGISSKQLLSLQRNDASRNIEIIPLDRKLIYKGLLKQLVPEQPRSNRTSLVRLVELVNRALAASPLKPAPKPDDLARQSPTPATAREPRSQSFEALTSQPKSRPAPVTGTPGVTSQVAVLTSIPKAKSPLLATQPTPTGKQEKLPQNNPLLGSLLRQVNKTTTLPGRTENRVVAVASRSAEAAPQTASANPSASAPKPPLENAAKTGTELANGKQIVSTGIDRAEPAPLPRPQAIPAAQPPYPLQTSSPRELNSIQPPPQTSTTPSILQILLQMMPSAGDVRASQLKQWFEFSSLIHAAKAGASDAASSGTLKSLMQLVDKTIFSRELEMTLQPGPRSPAADDSPAPKTMPQEFLLAHAREGIKLIEQALSQNLLQRTSIGMQQETQQPLSLSLALPLLDQQTVKSLHIDLEQRALTQDDQETSWDVRLNFELADLGPVSCHVFLQGATVAASFYCEHSRTHTLLEQALPDLRQQLSIAGFTAGEFHSFTGKPRQDHAPSKASYSESLIDIEV